MATAARAIPALEITAAPEAMDLHSDGGFDFGDGDIDLDLQSVGRQDDDLSLHDAGTDVGVDVQTTSADQDDFMVDNEDVIEEDVIDFDEDVDAGQPSTTAPGTGQQATAEIPDEDLIDYSDDEEQLIWNEQRNVSHSANDQDEHDIGPDGAPHEQSLGHEFSEPLDPAPAENLTQQYEEARNKEDHREDGSEPCHAEADPYGGRSNSDHQDDPNAENEYHEEGLQQQEDELYADEDGATQASQALLDEQATKEHDGDPNYQNDSAEPHPEAANEGNGDHARQKIYAHPVTVNYNGAELWLFKHHDHEDSGDYLIEFESLAGKEICYLFQACRAALGPDVTDMVELGFRFDHLHEMELYEDSTVCVCLSLERLISVYLRLHAQDGINDPESFYMTLLFRPRFSALLGELEKAASEGIGHTGLNNAIATGQTSFSAHYSHESTEQGYDDWENGEQKPELDDTGGKGEAEENKSAYSEEGKEVDHGEHYEEHIEEHPEQSYPENGGVEDAFQPQEQYSDNEPPAFHVDSINNASSGANDRASYDLQQETRDGPEAATGQSPGDSALAPRSKVQDDDFIDYSDDDGDAEVTQTGQGTAHQTSSSSSTVQGDDTAYGQGNVRDLANQVQFTEDAGQAAYDYEGGAEDRLSAQYADVDPDGEDFDAHPYGEEYNQDYDEGYNEDGFVNPEETEEYPPQDPAQADDDNTNYNNNSEGQAVDQSASSSLTTAVQDDVNVHVGENATLDGKFPDEDDLVDFDDDTADADITRNGQVGGFAGEDEIDYDDEDGEVRQAPGDVSAAAHLVVVSSAGLQDLSSQKQKRTIDEVGDDVGDATDSSDAKRPRV